MLALTFFLGVAIICDEFFVESLERISSSLKLTDDVAGATFMAAGSSAPELATAVVSILIEPGDEGLGTIVGSAVFNIMIIVGVTAIFAGQVLDISPYPFARDCIFYVISILMLVWMIVDKTIQWWDSFALVCGYFVYVGFMTQNSKVARLVSRRRRRRSASTGQWCRISERSCRPWPAGRSGSPRDCGRRSGPADSRQQGPAVARLAASSGGPPS